MNENQTNSKSYNDLVKFGVLLLIFAVVILVVSMVRPLIFGRIVPAVMGSGQVPVTSEQTDPTVPTPPTESLPASSYPAPESAVTTTTIPFNTGTITETVPPEIPTLVVTTPITHTLQPGENLTTIAQQYGVTVQAIIQANNLPNPDRIQAGTVLIIPANTEP
ncbi:MAG: LysM peptidoglycan-binding domain-containing protein [Chloroflexi bacterium]|nr:LysM peptidoglycan-binding domain-containing protein [Chloroflexota bacterium]MBP8060116.1 LysM peptidoglycan-binding domain-containing protein [Chloroflexota bacterium]